MLIILHKKEYDVPNLQPPYQLGLVWICTSRPWPLLKGMDKVWTVTILNCDSSILDYVQCLESTIFGVWVIEGFFIVFVDILLRYMYI